MTGRHAAPLGWRGEAPGWAWPDDDVMACRRMLRQIVATLEQAPAWLGPEVVDALETEGVLPSAGGDVLGFLVRDYRGEADDGPTGYYAPAAPQGALEAAAETGGTVTPLVAMRSVYRRRWLTGMTADSGQPDDVARPASQRPWAEGVVPL